MNKPGHSVLSIDAGSVSSWLHLLLFACKLAAIPVVLGGIIGFAFRGRQLRQVIASVVVSIVFVVVLEWRLGSPDWSWHFPITSLAYLFGPAAAFIGAPAVLAALFVGHLCVRYKVI